MNVITGQKLIDRNRNVTMSIVAILMPFIVGLTRMIFFLKSLGKIDFTHFCNEKENENLSHEKIRYAQHNNSSVLNLYWTRVRYLPT